MRNISGCMSPDITPPNPAVTASMERAVERIAASVMLMLSDLSKSAFWGEEYTESITEKPSRENSGIFVDFDILERTRFIRSSSIFHMPTSNKTEKPI